MDQRTLVIIKPDGVSRGLIGSIISQYEHNQLRVRNMKMLTLLYEMAKKHYEEHVGKSFFDSLMEYITSGDSVILLLEGDNAIGLVRSLNQDIRNKYSISSTINTVHGSDSEVSAKREIAHFFDFE